MFLYTLFVKRTITKGSFGGFEREITKFEGESKVPSSFVLEFISTINIQPILHRVQIWHFSRLIYYICAVMCIF
jgi:hypothetical protein